MTPPISKDWWLAAALTGAALPAAVAQTQTAPGPDGRKTGVVTTVTKGAAGTSAPLYIESTRGQRLTTGPNETVHVLFSDQSALTVGPNSEVVIAEYRYDTHAKEGNLLVQMTKGVLRVVGGFISKRDETRVRTSTATIGIRGGISIVEADGNQTQGTFLFGQHMSMVDNKGNSVFVTRPGFGVSTQGDGIDSPSRAPTAQLAQLLQRVGGPVPPPSAAPVAPPAPIAGPNPLFVAAGPDRVGRAEQTPGGVDTPPSLAKVLGAQAPGNQS